MASGEKIFNTSTYIQCRLAWTETDVNIANNTSRVWASMSYRRTNSYGYTTYETGYGFHVIIGGQWYKVGESVSIPPYDNNWHEIGAESRVLTHNDDGSLTVGIGCYHSGSLGMFDCNESTNATLDTIPRASTPTAVPSTLTLSNTNNTLTVNTNRKSDVFTHTLALTIGSHTETQTNVGASTTFSIPKTVLSSFASNSMTLDGTIVCTTYNSSTTPATQIGSAQTIHFTCQIDTAQEHPNIGTITLTDTNSASAAIETSGTFIKNASNLRAVIPLTVTGNYTQLASAVVQCGNTQQTYALSGTSQSITFTYDKLDADSLVITVYDKRGTSRAATKTWTLVPYRDLTVTGSVDRTTETGSTITFSLQGDCFAGSFGNTTNTITVDYKWKLSSDTNYTTVANAFTFTPSGSGETQFSYSNTLTGFDYDKQYNLIFIVKDMFTSAETRVLTLTVGVPVWAYSSDWFGVYGKQYLHFDRDNPSRYWDIKEGLDAIMQYHAQTNLLNITASGTEAKNGITYTVNSDGSVKAVGTASSNSWFKVGNFTAKANTTYVLTGCPSGGGNEVYGLEIMANTSVPTGADFDYGEGYEFTEQIGYNYDISLFIWSGQTVDLTFRPMIRDARIASDAYVSPFSKIKTVEYNFSPMSLNTNNGNECAFTLPNDFYKSLGVFLRDAWPNNTWANGAVVSICRDKTFEATTAGATSYVYLTTNYAQSYQIKLVLVYISK